MEKADEGQTIPGKTVSWSIGVSMLGVLIRSLNLVGFVDNLFMNESKYANEAAFADPEELAKTLAEWLPLSSSKCSQGGTTVNEPR